MLNASPLLLVLVLGALLVTASGAAVTIHVAPDGNDAWSGRSARPAGGDGPVASLERARDLVRAAGAAAGPRVVELAAGTYERRGPLELTAADSGTAEAPVTWRAAAGAAVRLVGGRVLRDWQPVTDPAVLARLDETVRGQVVRCDLKALGLTDYGQASGGGLELFCNDQPLTVSRWPNEGFQKIVDVVGGDPVDVRGTKGDRRGRFYYDGDRPRRWVGEADGWLHGYWFWDWADQRQKIESIDVEQRILSLAKPDHSYGYRKGQWYYAFNLLSEIDQPGEYCLDRQAGVVYLLPPGPLAQCRLVATEAGSLVTLKDVSHVTLRGLTLECCRGVAVSVEGGEGCRVAACTIRNTGSAVTVSGGRDHGVVGCDIYQMAAGGISLTGGDRRTLRPAGHYADHNHLHDYGLWKRMYSAGIGLYGVGNRAAHNLIDNAPHQAISFSGNDHLMEYNEIHSVCYESNDAGAIYAGRDWTMRGTVIRYNFFHHIAGFQGRGCVGVYLDDMYCGTTIHGNVFYEVTRAAMTGGGRDNVFDNNVFVGCVPAVHVDDRALNWAKYHVETTMTDRLKAMPYQEAPWRDRYPELVGILAAEPGAPKGNRITRNVSVGGKWDGVYPNARQYTTLADNLVDQDPHWATPDRVALGREPRPTDFALRPDSPAFGLGFQALPLDRMGLQQNPDRASWPVRSVVRPIPAPPSKAARGPAPRCVASRLGQAPVLDGRLDPAEWGGLRVEQALLIAQGPEGEKVDPPSRAWVYWDDTHLYVAADHAVDARKPLRPGNRWGQDDAVELAFQARGEANAPIRVLRGYPSGHFESSDEAGAPAAVVTQTAAGVVYRALVVDAGRWTCEWAIPLASLGLDPRKPGALSFNVSVRKTAGPAWLMWRGTLAHTWDVDQAGILELAR